MRLAGKLLAIGLIGTSLVSGGVQTGLAQPASGTTAGQDSPSAPAKSTGSGSTAGSAPFLCLPRRTTDDKTQLSKEGMLTDLRDTRLTLGQIKQQSINLFLEATRTLVKTTERPLRSSPSTISLDMIDEKEPYLPPRKEWLVFYLTTLEPLVHLLSLDIEDVDTNDRKVPPVIAERVNPIWTTWKDKIADINKSLDDLRNCTDSDEPNNTALAKTAVHIFERVNELEQMRFQAATIFREEYKKEEAAAATGNSSAPK